jgi:hypothetical protein
MHNIHKPIEIESDEPPIKKQKQKRFNFSTSTRAELLSELAAKDGITKNQILHSKTTFWQYYYVRY